MYCILHPTGCPEANVYAMMSMVILGSKNTKSEQNSEQHGIIPAKVAPYWILLVPN